MHNKGVVGGFGEMWVEVAAQPRTLRFVRKGAWSMVPEVAGLKANCILSAIDVTQEVGMEGTGWTRSIRGEIWIASWTW